VFLVLVALLALFVRDGHSDCGVVVHVVCIVGIVLRRLIFCASTFFPLLRTKYNRHTNPKHKKGVGRGGGEK
jgi:hypothetical protein